MRAENVEFFALIEAAGWNAAEAARQLKLDPSVISQYKSDKVRPSVQTLDLLKLILWRDRPGALTAVNEAREQSLADWERKVIEDLRWLHKDDRERVLTAMRAIISALPRRESVHYGKAPPKKDIEGVSSTVAGVATSTQASASELARHELQELQRRSKVDGPSESKRGQERGGRRAAKRKPGAQG